MEFCILQGQYGYAIADDTFETQTDGTRCSEQQRVGVVERIRNQRRIYMEASWTPD